jgi:hypothetical protein
VCCLRGATTVAPGRVDKPQQKVWKAVVVAPLLQRATPSYSTVPKISR